MVKPVSPEKTPLCLNCGSQQVENYCALCGQKAQATQQPLHLFLSEAFETLFNADSRWLATIKDLFYKPGTVTTEYISGKRVKYLHPVRLYFSISVVYFLMVNWVESSQVFFINFNNEDGNSGQLAVIVQYGLFFLVPLFAWISSFFYRKRKAFYVEYLVLALHIHSIWFVLMILELFSVWLGQTVEASWMMYIELGIGVPARIGIFVYLIAYLKKTFQESWLKSVAKSLGIMSLYVSCIAILMAVYVFILIS